MDPEEEALTIRAKKRVKALEEGCKGAFCVASKVLSIAFWQSCFRGKWHALKNYVFSKEFLLLFQLHNIVEEDLKEEPSLVYWK